MATLARVTARLFAAGLAGCIVLGAVLPCAAATRAKSAKPSKGEGARKSAPAKASAKAPSKSSSSVKTDEPRKTASSKTSGKGTSSRKSTEAKQSSSPKSKSAKTSSARSHSSKSSSKGGVAKATAVHKQPSAEMTQQAPVAEQPVAPRKSLFSRIFGKSDSSQSSSYQAVGSQSSSAKVISSSASQARAGGQYSSYPSDRSRSTSSQLLGSSRSQSRQQQGYHATSAINYYESKPNITNQAKAVISAPINGGRALIEGAFSTTRSGVEGLIDFGKASWYGKDFHGGKTANGERYDMESMTAAHRTLPFGTKIRVTNLENGNECIVRINNRGPYLRGRILDLSKGAARQLGMVGRGIARVKMEVLGCTE